MKILVTGATGYIGERLLLKARINNHDIIAASRRPPKGATPWLHFDFASSDQFILPKDIDAIIHLAANTSYNNENSEDEIGAARKLLSKAQQNSRVKFLFVSSQTAQQESVTTYGRTKWCIEQDVLRANGLVVRPGQVYGGKMRGLFGVLVNIVKSLVILPAFIPAPLIQPIHVDDLVEGLLKLVEHPNISSGLFCLASPQPVSFSYFLKAIAAFRLHQRRYFISIPSIFLELLTKAFKDFSCFSYLNRLNSLFSLKLMDTANDLQNLGLHLRPLDAGLHPSGDGKKRALIQEGILLLTYIQKKKPKLDLIRRYVRIIEKLRGGLPLNLPIITHYWPVTLALVDNSPSVSLPFSTEFNWRITAATRIAEATQEGAIEFIGNQPSSRILSLFKLLFYVAAEVLWRILSIIFIPLIRCYPKNPRAPHDSRI